MTSATSRNPKGGEAAAVEHETDTTHPDLLEEETGDVPETAEVGDGADWNVVERLFLTRRSIRRFKKKQVPAYLVRRILEIGRFAPSQGNCQPWKFVVVRDRRMIDEMEEYCVEACKKMAAAIDYATMPKGSLKYYSARLMARVFNAIDPGALHPVPIAAVAAIAEGRFRVFHAAPTVILLLMDKHGVGVPEVDIGIVGTNIIMAAESHGLGTCWIGFSKLLNRSKEWRERLGVTDRFELVEAICVGYKVGDPTQNLVERPTHEIVWFEDGRRRVLY